jgi:hypothetical protein
MTQAYFPPISQPEGLPLRVQDSKGKEWIFQFRFWPNNNSRMYVLEGVTPCIQNMQLQAGDIGSNQIMRNYVQKSLNLLIAARVMSSFFFSLVLLDRFISVR